MILVAVLPLLLASLAKTGEVNQLSAGVSVCTDFSVESILSPSATGWVLVSAIVFLILSF